MSCREQDISKWFLTEFNTNHRQQATTVLLLVNKIHFQPKVQWMICAMLDIVRSVSLDIWRIERYVCFWPLWFHPQWSCSLQYVYTSVCRFHAFDWCCMFPKSLLITFPLFPHCSLSLSLTWTVRSYLLQTIFRHSFSIRMPYLRREAKLYVPSNCTSISHMSGL